MAIKVLGLMHAGLRIAPGDGDVQDAADFYGDLLGLQMDEKRPNIPGIPGFWAYVGDRDVGQQIHIMGAEGSSPVARSAKQDPTRNHIALAVEDIAEAKAELERRGIEFWVYEGLVGPSSDQVFFEDGFANLIELQQAPA